MDSLTVEHVATIWTVDDQPVRMMYAGRRWRVTDTPTRLREAVWAMPLDGARAMYGWRFQATDEAGRSFVFDVFKADAESWHVHRAYD